MTEELKLTKDEICIILKMREYKGHAKFSIFKQPTKEQKDGSLVRIVIEKSELIALADSPIAN